MPATHSCANWTSSLTLIAVHDVVIKENDGERGSIKKMCAAVRVGLESALCQVVFSFRAGAAEYL